MATGQLNAQLPVMLIETVTKDNVDMTASSQISISIPCSKEGYTPIGILDWRIMNASSGGGRSSYIFTYCMRLVETDGNWSVYTEVRNTFNSWAKIAVTASVLYEKN